ncbi:hypothetical protein FJ251_13745 [bacterium]|nr:hypothetical protein [bacterium]
MTAARAGFYVCLLAALAIGGVAGTASATTREYPGSFVSLQEAFDSCAAGDTLLVAPGLYIQPQHRNVVHSGPAFTVLSSAGASETVFHCDYTGFWLTLDGVGSPSAPMEILGLTITAFDGAPSVLAALDCHSSCLELEDMIFEHNPGNGRGLEFSHGELLCRASTFRNCAGNALVITWSAFAIEGSSFSDNRTSGDGAGVRTYRSKGSIRSSRFTGNRAVWGGAIDINHGGALLEDLVFEGNTATSWGGGLHAYADEPVVIRNCVFRGNRAEDDGGAVYFIGNYGQAGDRMDIENCDFVGNSANTSGAAVFAYGSAELHITGCTFADNSLDVPGLGATVQSAIWSPFYMDRTVVVNSVVGGGVGVTDPAEVSITCSDVWNNPAGNYWAIPDPTGTNGNISSDPRFCGAAAADSLLLMNSSPCLPANNACGVLIGNHGEGCETSVAADKSWGQIKSLY